MKSGKRILSFLLTFSLLFSLPSCKKEKIREEVEAEILTLGEENPLVEDLRFSLTEEEVENAEILIFECRSLLLDPNTSHEELKIKLAELEKIYHRIATEEELAYLSYCIHRGSEECTGNYLFATEARRKIYEAYQEMCRALDASVSPWKEEFFADWSEEDLDAMRTYSKELTDCAETNEKLLQSYRSLSEENFFEGTKELYFQMLKNNQKIATLSGFSDYRTYAFEKIYGRAYEKEEILSFRAYVKRYFVPLCRDALQSFQKLYCEKLTPEERKTVERILVGTDTEFEENLLLLGYLSKMPEETGKNMTEMFEAEKSVFVAYPDSFEGAFTVYLYALERPFCYFGGNYRKLYTVVHEMGHYYAATVQGDTHTNMDLAEVQSQGNEWLFTAYLGEKLSPEVFQTVFSYALYHAATGVVLGTLVDEFEESCYCFLPSSSDELDARMQKISAGYGGESFLKTYVTDPNEYWRKVAPENPVYYFSYALSMIPALELYGIAKEDYDAGVKTYLTLTEETDGVPFPEILSRAGLSSPFEEGVYLKIAKMMP